MSSTRSKSMTSLVTPNLLQSSTLNGSRRLANIIGSDPGQCLVSASGVAHRISHRLEEEMMIIRTGMKSTVIIITKSRK
jgi:hypothetical protein